MHRKKTASNPASVTQYTAPRLIAHARRIQTWTIALENEDPEKDTQENYGEGRQTILYRELRNKTQDMVQWPNILWDIGYYQMSQAIKTMLHWRGCT